MRQIALDTPIVQKQLPPAADITLTKGILAAVVALEPASRSINYNTCLRSANKEDDLFSGGTIDYDSLDAGEQATVDAYLDLVLGKAQTANHIPAGTAEPQPA